MSVCPMPRRKVRIRSPNLRRGRSRPPPPPRLGRSPPRPPPEPTPATTRSSGCSLVGSDRPAGRCRPCGRAGVTVASRLHAPTSSGPITSVGSSRPGRSRSPARSPASRAQYPANRSSVPGRPAAQPEIASVPACSAGGRVAGASGRAAGARLPAGRPLVSSVGRPGPCGGWSGPGRPGGRPSVRPMGWLVAGPVDGGGLVRRGPRGRARRGPVGGPVAGEAVVGRLGAGRRGPVGGETLRDPALGRRLGRCGRQRRCAGRLRGRRVRDRRQRGRWPARGGTSSERAAAARRGCPRTRRRRPGTAPPAGPRWAGPRRAPRSAAAAAAPTAT